MKCFLDMDGVIADFFSAAVAMSETPNKEWRDHEFRDVQRVLNKIRKTPGFFRDLKPFVGTNTFVQCIQNIAGPITILSSPLEGYENCSEEKIEWLEKHLMVDVDVIITSDKAQYAEGNILIDDYGYNIRQWEEAGGFGIKYQADEQHMSDALLPLQLLCRGLK